MVDIIKLPSYALSSFPLNIQNSRSTTFSQQATLPRYLSNPNNIPQNDLINNLYKKRWISNSPSNPTRLLNVSNTPYRLHRKVMYQELSRPCPTTVDLSRIWKSKPQRMTNKDETKSIISNATTAIGTGGINMTSQTTFSHIDIQGSRLFDTLSKHVTIKPEPLRPANSFLSNSTNTLTSWQKYWTSTHAQRRRKDAGEPEPVLYRPKCEQPIPGQIHFVVLRDSPCANSELDEDNSQAPPTSTNNYSPNTLHISTTTTTSDKQHSNIKENENKRETTQLSTVECIAASIIPSVIELNSSISASKISITIPLKSTDKDDGKSLTEKSVLFTSSSYFKSDIQTIKVVSKAQIKPKPITKTVSKPSLPADKSKKIGKSSLNRRIRSKSKEKKETRTPPASKRKRHISANQKPANKPELLTIIAPTSRSKYSQTKWDAPYVGIRFDPPPPPSSPLHFVCIPDSDTSYQKSEVFDPHLIIKALKT